MMFCVTFRARMTWNYGLDIRANISGRVGALLSFNVTGQRPDLKQESPCRKKTKIQEPKTRRFFGLKGTEF